VNRLRLGLQQVKRQMKGETALRLRLELNR
jgi:hypothetical protein